MIQEPLFPRPDRDVPFTPLRGLDAALPPFRGTSDAAKAASRAGAQVAAAREGSQLWLVLNIIINSGPITRHGIHEITGISHTSLCARLWTLMKAGRIKEDDYTATGPCGIECVRYRLTEAT